MEITLSTLDDIDEIFAIYDAAIAYQKTITRKSWKGFKQSMVKQEIQEKRHFKIIDSEEIACTFLIAFKNPIIWKEANDDRALYLHRIATNPSYRGRGYIHKIVAWAKQYAKENGIDYIRMDTHSGNERLNQYYINAGFTYLGVSSIEWTPDLPEHYKEGPFSLFEMKIQ